MSHGLSKPNKQIMPELPEVETTKRGLEPRVVGKQVLSAQIHQKQLRWEIPSHLPTTIKGELIKKFRDVQSIYSSNLVTVHW